MQLLHNLAHLIIGFLQQGGHPQKPKGPLEALRPKLQVLKHTLIVCTNAHTLYCITVNTSFIWHHLLAIWAAHWGVSFNNPIDHIIHIFHPFGPKLNWF
jgi:hypothetical protein